MKFFLIIFCAVLCGGLGRAVDISEGEYESRAQFIVQTKNATWYYDRKGGGFSRLIDRDGKDWISFNKEPLSKYPDSAAAGYRGIPNCVFRGPDKGAGHPGFNKCISVITGSNEIRTVSHSGNWAWTWTFTESSARFKMEKTDPNQAWWFLYEGTVGGQFKPTEQYWGTDSGGPHKQVFGSKNQKFANWRWAYFGDERSARVLFVLQHQLDDLSDTLWHLGSSNNGSATAKDGMIVFGMGRAPAATPILKGSGIAFTIGLIEQSSSSKDDHLAIGRIIVSHLQ